jgi:hypothetical protein
MDVFFWAIDPRVAFWTRFEANFRLGGNQGPLFLNGLTSPRVPGQLRFFEIYADEIAYNAHINSAHFIKYVDATKDMITSKTLIETVPIQLSAK